MMHKKGIGNLKQPMRISFDIDKLIDEISDVVKCVLEEQLDNTDVDDAFIEDTSVEIDCYYKSDYKWEYYSQTLECPEEMDIEREDYIDHTQLQASIRKKLAEITLDTIIGKIDIDEDEEDVIYTDEEDYYD